MIKRIFDIVFSLFTLFLFFWVVLISWMLAIIDTHTNGIFIQERIGQFGLPFKIYKLRTHQISSSSEDVRISKIGQVLRDYKLDEMPQLFNVLKGDMSLVGPRPERKFFIDKIKVAKNEKQIYGTQSYYDKHYKEFLYHIDDEAGVNQRRLDVGLEKLEP